MVAVRQRECGRTSTGVAWRGQRRTVGGAAARWMRLGDAGERRCRRGSDMVAAATR
ncbi:hypothetical protein Scep_025485 [Stephania cephalantha]|uniref:Uncharacterized protein n=1 Tax=Stephania cephalantha TaxID=152367 RepID=A0AAP0EIB5_9MAGN